MRILSIAMLAVGVTGLLGAAEVRAQAASMSMSSCGGGASAGAAGAGSVGGWSLAPEASVKRKSASTGIKTATAFATTRRTTAGAWSVAPALEAVGEPMFGKRAPTPAAAVESKSQTPAGAAAVVASGPAPAAGAGLELNGARPTPEPVDTKSSKK